MCPTGTSLCYAERNLLSKRHNSFPPTSQRCRMMCAQSCIVVGRAMRGDVTVPGLRQMVSANIVLNQAYVLPAHNLYGVLSRAGPQ